MTRRIILLACSLAAIAAPKGNWKKRIEHIIHATPALERAHLGIRVVDLKGNVLFEHNARNWFIPASNTKLYSTAFALSKLGANHRMTTRVVAVNGDLRLIGGADPSLSGRAYPYDKTKEWGDVAPGIEALADQIVARGIRRIEGGIVGDDTAFVWDPFPNGWSIDDPLFEYGAPVSALTLQDNAVKLSVTPGAAAGDPASVLLSPDLGIFTLVPDVRTLAKGERARVRVDRPAHTSELRVHGTIAIGGRDYENLFAVDDPALYAARALEAALLQRGVVIRNPATVRHRTSVDEVIDNAGVEVAKLESRPLAEIVQVVNKVSQNLHAEMLLREAARKDRIAISREDAITQLREFLTNEIKLGKDDVNFEDGSGLSRLTLLTPEATTRLLVHMANSPERDAWIESLPKGGEDGTLSRRFNGSTKRVRAKTGSLSHVSALGGYLDHPRHGTLAFTVLLNNYNTPTAEARAGIDKLVMTLLE
jgi:D-alanyl-D-alanine carboxypeptidase/D-alanyl-D-alanine-endopeptidase (penicillin-binding protein 4)